MPRAWSTRRRCAKCSSASCAPAKGPIPGIHTSLSDGWLRAFALTGSSYTTGQSITWVQTREDDVDAVMGTAAAQEPLLSRCVSIT